MKNTTKKTSDKKIEYITSWKKEHHKQIKIDCNLKYDADILAKLDSVPQKATYIKALIREDIEKEK